MGLTVDEDEAAIRVQRRAGERDAEDYAKAVVREQADMAETQMHRAHRQATVQAQTLLLTIEEATALKYVRHGGVEEAEIRTSLDRGTLMARLDDAIGSLGCGRPVFPDFPGRERFADALKTVRHPVDLEPFKAECEIDCSEHGNHDAFLNFRGLELRELGIDACSCIGGSHRFENTSAAILVFGGLRLEPGAVFDLMDVGETTLAGFLASGLVKDLTAPEEIVEEPAAKTDRELLDQSVETWEQIQKPLRLEGE